MIRNKSRALYRKLTGKETQYFRFSRDISKGRWSMVDGRNVIQERRVYAMEMEIEPRVWKICAVFITRVIQIFAY